MQLIGFNFTKVSAFKSQNFPEKNKISTNIEFLNIEKENIPMLKEQEAIKISFQFLVTYTEPESKNESKRAEVLFEGTMIVSGSSEEIKNTLKNWKKKEIPSAFKIPLFNTILKRCSIKALDLEEQLNLPPHIPFPQVKPQN